MRYDTDFRIVYTRPGGPGSIPGEGPVSIVSPSARALHCLRHGGGLQQLAYRSNWPATDLQGFKRYLESSQWPRWVAAGMAEDAARQYIRRYLIGGASETEAWNLIIAKDAAPYGTGIETWPAEDVPADRDYRNAWRRAAWGGPIRIDLDVARDIQWQRIEQAAMAANEAALQADLRAHILGRSTNGPELIFVDERSWRHRIEAARSIEALRQLWPAELAHPTQRRLAA